MNRNSETAASTSEDAVQEMAGADAINKGNISFKSCIDLNHICEDTGEWKIVMNSVWKN